MGNGLWYEDSLSGRWQRTGSDLAARSRRRCVELGPNYRTTVKKVSGDRTRPDRLRQIRQAVDQLSDRNARGFSRRLLQTAWNHESVAGGQLARRLDGRGVCARAPREG